MAPHSSPSQRFLRLLRSARLDGHRLEQGLIPQLQQQLLEIGRNGPDRLELVSLLSSENDVVIRRLLETLLFDAVQIVRATLAVPERTLRGRIEFAKLTGGGLFVGAVIALMTVPSPLIAILVGASGAVLFVWGQNEQSLTDQEKARILADCAALDELRRLLQDVRV